MTMDVESPEEAENRKMQALALLKEQEGILREAGKLKDRPDLDFGLGLGYRPVFDENRKDKGAIVFQTEDDGSLQKMVGVEVTGQINENGTTALDYRYDTKGNLLGTRETELGEGPNTGFNRTVLKDIGGRTITETTRGKKPNLPGTAYKTTFYGQTGEALGAVERYESSRSYTFEHFDPDGNSLGEDEDAERWNEEQLEAASRWAWPEAA